MAISGTKRKRRGRPPKSSKPSLTPVPFNPEIPAQEQPILAEEMTAGPENPSQSNDGGINPSSDNFEKETAAIPATVGDDLTAAAVGGENPPGPVLSPALTRFAEAIGPEAVKGWINIPFEALAVAVDHPEMSLEEWEITIWAPAVSAVLEAHLPSLLQKSNHPEFAALAMCAGTYCIARYKVLSEIWKPKRQEKPDVLRGKMPEQKPDGPTGGITTLASPALSAS